MKLCRSGHHHSKVKQSYSFKVEIIILNSVVSLCLGLAVVHFDIDNLCYIANQSLSKKNNTTSSTAFSYRELNFSDWCTRANANYHLGSTFV